MTTQKTPSPAAYDLATSAAAASNEASAEEEMRQREAALQNGLWNPVLTPLVVIWTLAALAIVPLSFARVLTTVGVPQAMVICIIGAVLHSAAYLLGYGVLRLTKMSPTSAAVGSILPIALWWISVLT